MYALKKLPILAVTVFVIAICASSLSAQTNFQGGIHFNAGFPQGELKDQIDRNAYGLGGQIFFAPQKSPLALGIELGWMNYGSKTRNVPWGPTIPDVTLDVTTQNNIVQGFLVLRAHMPKGPIQLYGDALVGFNYLFTETKVSDEDDLDEIASSVNFDDHAFAYGFGGGLMVPIYTRNVARDGGKALQVSLDGGLRYILGGEAEYLTEDGTRIISDVVIHTPQISKTDMLRLHLGVSVSF
ncbi:MAG: hypothetical protein KKA42_04495 [candidate division Zixibacteria bacterium]|nr:hypothetical protein [candidate division Zixibacteria bacterium]